MIISLKNEISFLPISRQQKVFLKSISSSLFLCRPLSVVCIQVTGLHQTAVMQASYVGRIRKHKDDRLLS